MAVRTRARKERSETAGAANAFAEQAEGESFAGETLVWQSIPERVAARILAMIKSGNLRPGDRLPTEQKMGIAFGISRPALREALKALKLMGVLQSRQGGRYTVSDLSPSRLVAPFNAILSTAEYDVHDHFKARAVVELELVRLGAERASDADRQRIVKLARDGRSLFEDPVAFRLMDIELHQAIYDAGGAPMLSAIARGLYDVGLDFRRVASTDSEVIKVSVAQHCEVADAISAGDADTAADAYHRHLEHVRDSTIQSMAAEG